MFMECIVYEGDLMTDTINDGMYYVPPTSFNSLDKVKEFHRAFDQPISDVPNLPKSDSQVFYDILADMYEDLSAFEDALKAIQPADQRVVRVRLLVEEFAEYIKAEYEDDIKEIADAMADIEYINNGTAAVYGIPLDQIFDVVHQNNMTKLGPDGKPIVVNSKIQKPEGYIKVSLDKFFPVKE